MRQRPKLIHVSHRLFSTRFPKQEGLNEGDVKMTDVSRYSITHPLIAETVASILQDIFKTTDVIVTDAFASIGGVTIALAKRFTKIFACEIEPVHCDCLKHNLRAFGLDSKVEILNGDFMELYPMLQGQQAIFLDPPWGGPSYKLQPVFEYPLVNGTTTVPNLIIEVLIHSPTVRVVLLLAPNNLNVDKLRLQLSDFVIVQHVITNVSILVIMRTEGPQEDHLYESHLPK